MPGENNRPTTSHRQTLSHNVVHLTWVGFELTMLVDICTDCISSCKSNYHTITTMTAHHYRFKIFNQISNIEVYIAPSWHIAKWKIKMCVQLSSEKCRDAITQFNSATFLCLSLHAFWCLLKLVFLDNYWWFCKPLLHTKPTSKIDIAVYKMISWFIDFKYGTFNYFQCYL